jgi:hypothetical protein
MSNPFSFLSSHSDDPALPAAGLGALENAAPVPASAEPSASTPLFEEAPMTPPGLLQEIPASAPSESLFFRPIPYMAPLGVSPGSALSGALHGKPPERQMPPPNRRPAAAAPVSPAFGGTASAPVPAPSSWPPGQISSREIAQLRLEVREELEQVKNDLFGAATGVSALKDRLDGLEQAVTKAGKTAMPRMEELQAWVDQRIEQAVTTAVARAFEAAFGGVAARLRSAERPNLAEAPVVLSSSPS